MYINPCFKFVIWSLDVQFDEGRVADAKHQDYILQGQSINQSIYSNSVLTYSRHDKTCQSHGPTGV